MPPYIARVIIWQCPYCTWFRARTSREEWERTIIQHPLYGFITNFDAFARDVKHHNCQLTREARIRLGVDPNVVYDPYVYDKNRDKKRYGRIFDEGLDSAYSQAQPTRATSG